MGELLKTAICVYNKWRNYNRQKMDGGSSWLHLKIWWRPKTQTADTVVCSVNLYEKNIWIQENLKLCNMWITQCNHAYRVKLAGERSTSNYNARSPHPSLQSLTSPLHLKSPRPLLHSLYHPFVDQNTHTARKWADSVSSYAPFFFLLRFSRTLIQTLTVYDLL